MPTAASFRPRLAFALFTAWLRRRWPARLLARPPRDPRHALGRRGERLAARFLRRQGYKALYRGFRAQGGGEVDLTCRDGDTLVFVEVKTRASRAFGDPADAVDTDKQRLIAQGARAWLRMLDDPRILYRFDIVEVLAPPGARPECRLIKSAFVPPDRDLY